MNIFWGVIFLFIIIVLAGLILHRKQIERDYLIMVQSAYKYGGKAQKGLISASIRLPVLDSFMDIYKIQASFTGSSFRPVCFISDLKLQRLLSIPDFHIMTNTWNKRMLSVFGMKKVKMDHSLFDENYILFLRKDKESFIKIFSYEFLERMMLLGKDRSDMEIRKVRDFFSIKCAIRNLPVDNSELQDFIEHSLNIVKTFDIDINS